MGVTIVGKHKMEISDSKPTSKPSSNNVRIVRIGEVDFFTAFVGVIPGNKIYGLMKVYNGYCNKYNTHVDQDKGHVESALYIATNGKTFS